MFQATVLKFKIKQEDVMMDLIAENSHIPISPPQINNNKNTNRVNRQNISISFGVKGLFLGPLGKNKFQSWFPDFQKPPPADEFSDPNLTPLPANPGIKYVARALAAM